MRNNLICRCKLPTKFMKKFSSSRLTTSYPPRKTDYDFFTFARHYHFIQAETLNLSKSLNPSPFYYRLATQVRNDKFRISLVGRVSKWLKDADCKSARFVRSSVRIRPLPPLKFTTHNSMKIRFPLVTWKAKSWNRSWVERGSIW